MTDLLQRSISEASLTHANHLVLSSGEQVCLKLQYSNQVQAM